MPLYIVRDLLGGDLSVVGRQGNDLVAGGFDRAGLVAVDVTADGGQYALPGPQDRGDDRGVGLGAAYQKMHVGVRGLTRGLDLLTGRRADLVLAVADGLHHIGLGQPRHDRAVCALKIITVEIDHDGCSFFKSFPDSILSYLCC